jgi:hypothetical protein
MINITKQNANYSFNNLQKYFLFENKSHLKDWFFDHLIVDYEQTARPIWNHLTIKTAYLYNHLTIKIAYLYNHLTIKIA